MPISAQFSSVQDDIYPLLSEFYPNLPLKRFQCSSVRCLLFPRLSPPGNPWCDILGFVPAGSVSSFSTLQIIREATCEGCFARQSTARSFPFTPACPGQYTHRRFRRWMSTIDTFHSGLPIPFFSLFVASLLNV